MSMYHCPRCDETRDSDWVEIVWFEVDNELVCVECLTEREWDEWERSGYEPIKRKSSEVLNYE